VYEGRRVARYQKRLVTLHYYKISTEWMACFKKKPFSLRHTVGDIFTGITCDDGPVAWLTLVKAGRVPDREAAVLAMRERVSLATKAEQQQSLTSNSDPIRKDLERYRNLYKLANTDNARAAVLAQVISAIVSGNK
jgi:hypothetical protein